MRLYDLIKLSFKSIVRNGSSIIIILLISILSFSVMYGLSFKDSFNNYWDKYIENNIDFRIFSVSYEKIKDDIVGEIDINKLLPNEKVELLNKALKRTEDILSTIPHVDGYTTADGYMIDIERIEYDNKKISESLYLIGVPNKTYIDIVNGNSLNKYNLNEKVMICSNNLQSSYDNSSKNDYDTNSVLNEELNVVFSNGKYINYKIVGVYDKLSTYAIGNSCYTSYENVKGILEEQYRKDIEVNSKSLGYYGESLYLMIDSRSNINTIINDLNKYNISIEPIIMIDTEILNQVVSICSYIILFTFIFTVLVVFFNILTSIKDKNKSFYIYNVTGYTKHKIMLINIFENGIVGIISFLVSIMLLLIGCKLFNNIIISDNVRLYLFRQNIDIYCLMYGLAISFIVPILISFVLIISNKFINNNILE